MKTTFLIPSLALFLFACDSDKGVTVFNPSPEAEITSHSEGDEVLEGYIITFVGNVSDANHSADKLTATWKIGTETLCEAAPPESDGTTTCEAVLTPDDTEITLEVKDTDNARGEATVSLVVVPSEAPVAEIITPESSGVYYSDQKITFEGLLSDEEDDADLLVASWKSDLDGELTDVDTTPDSGGSILGYGYLTEGEHAIELNVEDTTGKTDRASVIINVGPPNSAPLCEILTPEDGSAGPEGETIDFTATASDADVEPDWLSVTWTSDKDGEIGTSTPTSDGDISFSFAGLSVNSHTITMKVTDEVGATCTKAIDYTIGTAPSITIDAPTDGDVINEGSSITFSATVSDAQDQPNDVSLDWSLNGNSVSTQGATSSGTAEFSDATLAYGTYNLVVTATDTDGLTDSDQINFTVNGIPSQPDISITPDPAYTDDGLSVVINTDSVDPEGTSVNYTYEWLLGGNVQSSYTTSSLPSSATSKGEQWMVRVTPDDGIASGDAGTATITIANTAPTLSGMSITPTGTTYNDDSLTCSATVTDPDETPTTTYEWSIGGNVIGTSATIDLSTSGAMPDDVVTCTITVSDSDDATATDSITRTVTNRAPTLSNTNITPATGITTGSMLTCDSTVSDDDGESLTANYTWSVGSNNNAGTGATLQLTPSMGAPGDAIVCTVDVVDGYGGSAVDTVTATISNTDPVISEVSINYSGDLTSTTSLTCDYTATDADNQTLTPAYAWTNLSTNTAFSSTASTLQLTPSSVSPNDVVECSVTVSDPSGGTATLAATDTVGNTDPTFLTNATITTTGTQVGDTWTCFASGTDQDDGALTPTYEWQDASGTVLSSTNTLVLSGSNSTPTEDITCIATITDGNGASATSSASETVSNTAPVFDVSASLSPTSAVTSTLLLCSGTASDADGDTPALSYAWSNSNGTTYGSTGNTLQLTPSTVSPAETVTCTITATDDQGDTIESQASVTVDNTLPTVTASISANGTSNTGELTCSATASDVDDFPTTPTLNYEWFDGTGSSLGMSNPLQLDSTMGVDGDDISCVATATDLSGGTASDTATHTITNTAPVIDSISLSPASPDVNTSALTCNVTGSDADGDTVTFSYEWLVDNQPQSETTNMFTGPFIVGSIIACRSTPSDGKIDGNVGEDTATVANTPPVVDSVSLSPSTVYTNDTITATATVSDADSGQTLSTFYEWHVIDADTGVDNVPSSGYGIDTYTGFSKDDEVYVIVTVNDNIDHSAPVTSSSITISNSVPTAPSISISPDPATAGQDDLVCSVDTPSSDDDGDSVVYTYVWTDDSGTVQQTTTESASTSDTFLASGTSEGTWTCEVTPYDMTDYGSSGYRVITVNSYCFFTDCDSSVDLGNGQGIDFVSISNGIFMMGSPTSEVGRNSNEDQHQVTLNNNFSVSTTEITQGMYHQLMGYQAYDGYSATYGLGTEFPAYYVSWHMAADFSNKLTQRHNTLNGASLQECYSCSSSGNPSVTCSTAIQPIYQCTGYRLPTEAEWEYAARAGSTAAIWTPNGGGNLPNGYTSMTTLLTDGFDLTTYAWYAANNSPNSSKEVATKIPNDYGLYDMSGNIWEWTHDSYTPSLGMSATEDPVREIDSYRVIRGGRWSGNPYSLRSAVRLSDPPTVRYDHIGFRLVFSENVSIPSAPEVSLSPSSPTEGVDELICIIDTESVDPDGNPITYTFFWTVDGVAHTGSTSSTTYTDDTIPATETGTGEEWECTVLPNDGTEDGYTGTASVTIASACGLTDCDSNLDLGGGQSVDFVNITSGTFMMGSPGSELGRDTNEDYHQVTLTNDFLVSTTEITQGMYNQLMGYQAHDGRPTSDSNGSYGVGTDYPAWNVSWHMAADFSNKLTQRHNTLNGASLQECYSCSSSGNPSVTCSTAIQPIYQCTGYRLPTEAEWEYAARAGSTAAIWTPNGGGDISGGYEELGGCNLTWTLSDGTTFGDLTWFCGNHSGYNSSYAYGSKEVATKTVNDNGLYDMNGNLYEWTHDAYTTSLGTGSTTDPVHEMGSLRLLRGGCWYVSPKYLRSAFRDPHSSAGGGNCIGFRPVRSNP